MDLTKETQEELDNSRELENIKRVEAALFISGKFLSLQELVALTDLNPILLEHSLSQLVDKYNAESAIEVVNKGEFWKMDVRNEFRDIVNKLATGNNEFTKAEQETLAIIAYKHPITQSKIIQIRGNKAYEHIRKFVDIGLVNPKRKGRTYELALSDDFYDYFSVKEKEKIIKSEENEPFNEKVPNKPFNEKVSKMNLLEKGSQNEEEEKEDGVEDKPFNEKVVENKNSHTSDSDESKVSKINLLEKGFQNEEEEKEEGVEIDEKYLES